MISPRFNIPGTGNPLNRGMGSTGRKAVLLLAFLVLVSGNLSYGDGYYVDGIQYRDFEDGGVEIHHFQTGFDDVEHLVVPAELPTNDGMKPVTRITSGAFPYENIIQRIDIPDSVVFIGDYAFMICQDLLYLNIGSGLANRDWAVDFEIPGFLAFEVAAGNTNFASIDGVLFNKDLSELILYPRGKYGPYVVPETVTKIGILAFAGSTQLTAVTLPDQLTELEYGAFGACQALTEISLPDSLHTINETAFGNCPALATIDFGAGVEVIEAEAFWGCSSLSNIIFPDQLSTIEEYAFLLCSSLSSVHFGSGVSIVEPSAFTATGALTTLTVDEGNPYLQSVDNVLYSKDLSVLKLVPSTRAGTFTVPDHVRTIGERALESCVNLTELVFNEGLLGIGEFAISSCTQLTELNLPDSLESIGSMAFYRCSGIVSVQIGTDLATLASDAFRGCTALADFTFDEGNPNFLSQDGIVFDKGMTRVVRYPIGRPGPYAIPEGITDIGERAFSGCPALSGIQFPDSLQRIADGGFSSCSLLDSIGFGSGLESIGAFAFSGCDSLTQVVLPTGISSLGDQVFYSCDNLSSVSIPGTVTSIGKQAFSSCRALSSVSLGNGIETIGDQAFSICYSLVSITLPTSVRQLGERMFYSCGNLQEIVIQGPVVELGSYFAYYCLNLQAVTLPESLLSIGDSAFYDCKSLAQITLPAGLQTIGKQCFGRTGLTSVHVPGSVERIPESAFTSCDLLTTVTLNEGLLYIDSWAFDSCGALSSITIPNSTITIGEYAFRSCDKLRNVVFGSGLQSIGNSAFTECGLLRSAVLPDSMIALAGDAFESAPNFNKLYFRGDAPEIIGTMEFYGTPTLYFFADAQGFTEPTWMGFPSVALDRATLSREEWLAIHFPFPALSMDDEMNGVPLLLSYALDLDVFGGNQSFAQTTLVNGQLEIEFFTGRPDIRYSVEYSEDLHTWSADGIVISPADLPHHSKTSVPVSDPEAFLRIRVDSL